MYRMFDRRIIILLCLFGHLLLCHAVTVKLGILLMTSSPWPFDIRRNGPAIDEGIMVAERDYNVTFEPVYHNYTGICPLGKTVGHMAQLLNQYHVQAVIGPACSEGIVGAARLAEFFEIPILTGLGDLVVRNPNNNDTYNTLTLLSYNIAEISHSLSAILKTYEYRHIVVFYEFDSTVFKLAGANLVKDLRYDPYFNRPYEISYIPTATSDYAPLLLEAKTKARVYIFFTHADTFREIMYTAYRLGMANGEFVFITLELSPSEWLGYYKLFTRGDYKDRGVTKAYETVLILTLRKLDNPEYYVFADKVKQRARDDYGYEFPADENVNYFTTAFYDAVMYLANAYNQTVEEGGDINDGKAIAQKFWNSSFPGILGPVGVNEIGDRVADFDLFDMNSTETRAFQRVGRFRGALYTYTETSGVSIVWPQGKPLDVPTCGFEGELCIEEKVDYTDVVVSVVVVVLVVGTSILLIGLCFYRRHEEEQAIGKKTWLIQSQEIQSRKGKFNDSFFSKSLTNEENPDEQVQVFCQRAFCKNQVVAVRKLRIHNIELTRELTVDFRHMQRMSHANLAIFVGACLDPGQETILMEYCPRGSLQDVIKSETIDMDWDFKYSLIKDIIKGMVYLHSSPLRVHGNFTSSNCCIDSRFALKITDYGPVKLLTKDREEGRKLAIADGTFNKRKLFWTAPEILRDTTGTLKYSQAADVYGFGIILSELILRQEPYEENAMDTNDIIEQLISKKPEILRPKVSSDACSPELMEIMTSSWKENPDERYTFNDIDEIYKKLKRGKATNIMENLLQRMSDYADNLEQLAAERTKCYYEEKQKVEEFLHRLLPETVAKQVQAGRKVVPELFDCASVYFSEIVEFTTICDKSSPIQVVDLLNDLYTMFDSAIRKYKVYTVTTTGDAHMCVSGLPERIGDRHVAEICDMSLTILDSVKGFKIRHMPDEPLIVQIGLHSGPVVAGVVGLTMPRYCLFGDTVDTASRIESNSEPNRIHMSNSTKKLLEQYPEYNVELRGEISVKAKGTMKTYWLLGKNEATTNSKE